MMKTVFYSAVLMLLLVVTGCTELRLANGVYAIDTPGRGDMATVYNEQIFLRLRNAEEDGLGNGYWDWAGKYKIIDDGRIVLKMDRKSKRDWDFYYNLTMRGNEIVVDDLRAEKTYLLKWRPAVTNTSRGGQNFAPMSGGDVPQALPAYK